MEEILVEKIIRSRRRTIALEITSGATLVSQGTDACICGGHRGDNPAEEIMDSAEN